MTSGTWKAVLLPPLFALAFYLFTTYGVLPLYNHYIRTAQYTPLQISGNANDNGATSTRANQLFEDFRARMSDLLGRAGRRRSDSFPDGVGPEGFLGDEELEEGVVLGVGGREGGERRLSRELEGGFMDDSDDDDVDHRGRGEGGRARQIRESLGR